MGVVLPFVIGAQPAPPPPTQANVFDANFNALAAAINGLPVNTGIPWVTGGGTANAITATYPTPVVALTDGLTLQFRATAANTSTTPTFSPNGLTAHTITKKGGLPLVNGDIPGNLAECIVVYNLSNTRWELINPITTPFVSTQQTITAGGLLTLAHGLGVAPDIVQTKLHNTTAEHNYSLGQEVLVYGTNGNLASAWTHSIVIDATNISVRFGTANPTYQGLDFSTGGAVGFTNASWTLIVSAWNL